jgi:DNA helicase TIP49 (TBP-interacting protein)
MAQQLGNRHPRVPVLALESALTCVRGTGNPNRGNMTLSRGDRVAMTIVSERCGDSCSVCLRRRGPPASGERSDAIASLQELDEEVGFHQLSSASVFSAPIKTCSPSMSLHYPQVEVGAEQGVPSAWTFARTAC